MAFSLKGMLLDAVLVRAFGRIVKGWIQGIEVAAVQMFLNGAKGFPEPLEMHDLAFAEEADRVADLRIFDDPQDIIVGGTRFLLCCYAVRTTQAVRTTRAVRTTQGGSRSEEAHVARSSSGFLWAHLSFPGCVCRRRYDR